VAHDNNRKLCPEDHFLRKLEAALDLSFVYEQTMQLYRRKGRPSVDPVMLVKSLMRPIEQCESPYFLLLEPLLFDRLADNDNKNKRNEFTTILHFLFVPYVKIGAEVILWLTF